MKTERQILFYESYFQDFYVGQNYKLKEKIAYVFKLISCIQNIPTKF